MNLIQCNCLVILVIGKNFQTSSFHSPHNFSPHSPLQRSNSIKMASNQLVSRKSFIRNKMISSNCLDILDIGKNSKTSAFLHYKDQIPLIWHQRNLIQSHCLISVIHLPLASVPANECVAGVIPDSVAEASASPSISFPSPAKWSVSNPPFAEDVSQWKHWDYAATNLSFVCVPHSQSEDSCCVCSTLPIDLPMISLECFW